MVLTNVRLLLDWSRIGNFQSIVFYWSQLLPKFMYPIYKHIKGIMGTSSQGFIETSIVHQREKPKFEFE